MRPGLYAIVDVDALRERSALSFVEALLRAGPLSALQLRAKRLPGGPFLRLAEAIAGRCARAEVPFFVNDRPDVALLAKASGVHVGQDDLAADAVRSFAPSLALGSSTHSEEQARGALACALAYVALGPVFATTSKADAEPVVGLALLRTVVALAGSTPVVAIGGISLANAASVRAAGATAGAVIGALSRVHDDEVTATARALHLALGGER